MLRSINLRMIRRGVDAVFLELCSRLHIPWCGVRPEDGRDPPGLHRPTGLKPGVTPQA